MQFSDDKIWDPLIKTRGFHFCHLNVNGLLSKTDELKDITIYIKPGILRITESKLDSSVTHEEVNINGYSIIRNDRNRNGGGVACYTRNYLCLQRIFFQILSHELKTTRQLNKNFSILCDWFVDNKQVFILVKIKQNQFCLAANIKLRIQNH